MTGNIEGRGAGVLDRRLDDVPIAVLDFETTGLSPKAGCRVVEIAVVRADPGQEPRLVLDTLVDPEGPVYATRIHGIDDDDVRGAPRFRETGHWLAESLSGAVVATYNASFDLGFLSAEVTQAWKSQAPWQPPYVCLMWLRPLLGIGKRCSLVEACGHYGVSAGSHRAADDAMAAAHLWRHYVGHANANQVHRFSDLRSRGKHKYLQSFESALLAGDLAARVRPTPPSPNPKTRSHAAAGGSASTIGTSATERVDTTARRRTYWHALVGALRDYALTSGELDELSELRARLSLSADEIRAIHGRLFGQVLAAATADELVTSQEAATLRQLREGLHSLGWAPGDV